MLEPAASKVYPHGLFYVPSHLTRIWPEPYARTPTRTHTRTLTQAKALALSVGLPEGLCEVSHMRLCEGDAALGALVAEVLSLVVA